MILFMLIKMHLNLMMNKTIMILIFPNYYLYAIIYVRFIIIIVMGFLIWRIFTFFMFFFIVVVDASFYYIINYICKYKYNNIVIIK